MTSITNMKPGTAKDVIRGGGFRPTKRNLLPVHFINTIPRNGSRVELAQDLDGLQYTESSMSSLCSPSLYLGVLCGKCVSRTDKMTREHVYRRHRESTSTSDDPSWLDEEKEEQLKKRFKEGTDEEDKWREMFGIIFPQDNCPYPCKFIFL